VHPHKSLYISVSIHLIQTNKTPQESPWWALKGRPIVTSMEFNHMDHHCSMHPKNSVYRTYTHTNLCISLWVFTRLGQMTHQNKALNELYKGVISSCPWDSTHGSSLQNAPRHMVSTQTNPGISPWVFTRFRRTRHQKKAFDELYKGPISLRALHWTLRITIAKCAPKIPSISCAPTISAMWNGSNSILQLKTWILTLNSSPKSRYV